MMSKKRPKSSSASDSPVGLRLVVNNTDSPHRVHAAAESDEPAEPFLTPQTRLFTFRQHWHRVRPLLHDPEVRFVLDDNLVAHAAGLLNHYRIEQATPGQKVRHLFRFKPGDCPLNLAHANYWGCVKPVPRKDSVGRYQVWDGCHALAPWVLAIGKRLYPSLSWSIRSSDLHSIVIGCLADEQIRWFMDILFFEECSPDEQFVWTRSRAPAGARSLDYYRPRRR